MLKRARLGSLAVATVTAWCALAMIAMALDPKSTDPRAIIRAAFESQTVARSTSRLKMLIHDRSGSRERLLSVRTKRFEDARKTLILIEQPPDVRNTGFLSIDYRASGRPDEQWLFVPKLHRVARVPASGKANPFVGSDFSIFDLSQQDADSYDVTLADANAKVGDEPCWLIEGTPHDPAVKQESGYEKSQFWVSKSKLVVLQLKAILIGGRRAKYYRATDLRNDKGEWTPHRLQMRTLEGSDLVSETTVEVLVVDNDGQDVSDDDFTQQRLERGI